MKTRHGIDSATHTLLQSHRIDLSFFRPMKNTHTIIVTNHELQSIE